MLVDVELGCSGARDVVDSRIWEIWLQSADQNHRRRLILNLTLAAVLARALCFAALCCAASTHRRRRVAPLRAVPSSLQVGYATFYTMLPVFSLVLDEDVDESKVFLYPELYKELQKGRPLSYKTFFIWLFQSVYQGGVIMILVLLLFEARFLNIVSITFTALVASELLNVALEIHKWHTLMVLAEVGSVLVYVASLFFLPSYFGHHTQTHSPLTATACACVHSSLSTVKMLTCVSFFFFFALFLNLFLCACFIQTSPSSSLGHCEWPGGAHRRRQLQRSVGHLCAT